MHSQLLVNRPPSTSQGSLVTVYATLTPIKLAAIGLTGWLTILMIGPVTFPSEMDAGAMTYLLFSLAALLTGMGLVSAWTTDKKSAFSFDSYDVPAILFRIVLIVGAAGLIMRGIDRFVLRGMALTTDLWENRISTEDTLPTPLGILGGLLFPFGLALLPLSWSLPQAEQTRSKAIIAYLFLAYPAFEALSVASRANVLQVAFLWFYHSSLFGRHKQIVRNPAMIAMGVFLMLIFFQAVFALRTSTGYDIDFLVASQTSGYALFLPPSEWAVGILAAGTGIFSTLIDSWLHFTQYLCHSIFVYFENFQSFTGIYTEGALNFGLFVKTYYNLLGVDKPEFLAEAGGLVGLSGTFFTPLYYDFGWFGPPICLALGAMIGGVHNLAMRRPWQWAPLDAYLCFGSMTIMVDNPFTGGFGTMAIISLTLYGFAAGLFARATRQIHTDARTPIVDIGV